MERKESKAETQGVGNGEDNKFVLEYPENYNEIVEGMMRKAERECEYIKRFEIKEKHCHGESKGSFKEQNDSDDEGEDSDSDNNNDNDKHHYVELNEDNDDDGDNNNCSNGNNNNDTKNDEQQAPFYSSVNDNTNIKSNPSSQNITATPFPNNNSSQPEINSSKIKQMLSRVNIPPPSWASSLSDEAFLSLILPSLQRPASSNQ